MPEKTETIVVVGAGVIGLSTALQLQEQLAPHQKILLAARDWPFTTSINYASPWAGAHYRPVPGNTPQALREETQARRTYAHLKHEATIPASGVEWVEGIEHLEDPPREYLAENALDNYTHLEGFRKLTDNELPTGVKWGVRYMTFTINSPVYCAYLLRRFILRGGETKETALVNVDEAFYLAPNVRTVVNCSGTGIGMGDSKSFIIRGQTCLVRNPVNVTLTRQNSDGTWSFCIPRPLEGGTIIGGTKQVNDWDPNPSLATRETLLRNATKWFPFAEGSKKEFDVIRDIVGRRPAREGGMRIEREEVGQRRTVVHGYGAAGRGFEISWGVAEDVVKLVKEAGLVGGKERAKL
ncbi:FAD-dependent oxidoreductase [Aspergillus undulatus]|uniref:FAD-dependent oxidoreductase n=1 Tax=Aspergillus undulatus TaxID=1810928 RepID=UPI003CCD4063